MHEKIVQLKMLSNDNKMRLTDTLDTEGIFRIIKFIPGRNTEMLCTK